MKSNKKSKIAMCMITAVIAICEFAVLQILIILGLTPEGGVNTALSILLTAIVYIIASIIFAWLKQPRNAMWVAILAFVFLCIFVWYSKTLIDILSFIVVLSGLLCSMTILNEKIKEQEDTK